MENKKMEKAEELMDKFTSIRSEYETEAYGLKEEAEALMEGVSGDEKQKLEYELSELLNLD